jgi:hypothetical protein
MGNTVLVVEDNPSLLNVLGLLSARVVIQQCCA